MPDIFVHPIILLASHSHLRMLVRAHNTIRAGYVSSAYMMHGSETLYVIMLLQLLVDPVERLRTNLHKFQVIFEQYRFFNPKTHRNYFRDK